MTDPPRTYCVCHFKTHTVQQRMTRDRDPRYLTHREPRWSCFTFFIFTYPSAVSVVGAPQITSQPLASSLLCLPLPSGTWRTPGLSIPLCFLPTSFSVCLLFLPLSLCLAIWFWRDLMNGRHVHTTSGCVSLQWSAGLRVVRLPARSWHRLPRL